MWVSLFPWHHTSTDSGRHQVLTRLVVQTVYFYKLTYREDSRIGQSDKGILSNMEVGHIRAFSPPLLLLTTIRVLIHSYLAGNVLNSQVSCTESFSNPLPSRTYQHSSSPFRTLQLGLNTRIQYLSGAFLFHVEIVMKK